MDDDDADYMQGSDEEVRHRPCVCFVYFILHRIMASTTQTETRLTSLVALM